MRLWRGAQAATRDMVVRRLNPPPRALRRGDVSGCLALAKIHSSARAVNILRMQAQFCARIGPSPVDSAQNCSDSGRFRPTSV